MRRAGPFRPRRCRCTGWRIAALASALVVLALAWLGPRRALVSRLRLPPTVSAGGAAAALWVGDRCARRDRVGVQPAGRGAARAGRPRLAVRDRARDVDVGPRPRRAGVIGLALPAPTTVHYSRSALGLGPLDLAWLAFLITAGGHISPLAALVLSMLAGCLCGVVAVVRTRRRVVKQDEPEPITTRGPLGYAGPGSLGGTESALRR